MANNSVNDSPELRFMAIIRATGAKVKALATRLQSLGYTGLVTPGMVDIGMTALQTQYDSREIIETCIHTMHNNNCWDPIYNQTEEFFEQSIGVLFDKFDEEKKAPFIQLFLYRENGKKLPTDAERAALWELLGALMREQILYIHQLRGPLTVADETTGQPVHRYTVPTEFDHVDIGRFITAWAFDVDNGVSPAYWDLRGQLKYPTAV